MEKTSIRLQKLFRVCAFIAAAAVAAINGYTLAVVAAVAIGWALWKKPIPHFTLILLAGGLVLRLALAAVIDVAPTSDFLVMYKAAQSLLAGDLSFTKGFYFTLWAYQSAFVAWEAMWLSLWNSITCLEIVNGALSAGLTCLLYRIMRRYVSERAAQAAAILLTLQPFALTLHVLLSNQIPAAFFLVLGLWVLVCDDCEKLRFGRYPLAGLLLQLGNVLRSEGIVVLVAVAAWAVFALVREQKKDRLRLAAGVAALLAVYFAAGWGAGAAVRASGFNENGLSNGDPNWKFVVGLNAETFGGYSQQDWELIAPTFDENFHTTEATDEVQHILISARLKRSPLQWVQLFSEKIRRLWGTETLSWVFMDKVKEAPREYFGLLTRESAFNWLIDVNTGLSFLALALGAAGLWDKKYGRPSGAYLPYFVFFAAFCAFLLVEVQSRYVYLPQIFVFAGSAYGGELIYQKLDRAKGPAQPAE